MRTRDALIAYEPGDLAPGGKASGSIKVGPRTEAGEWAARFGERLHAPAELAEADTERWLLQAFRYLVHRSRLSAAQVDQAFQEFDEYQGTYLNGPFISPSA